MKLKPNPRNALGKEEMTEKTPIPEHGNLQRILSKKPTTKHKTNLGIHEFQHQRNRVTELNKHNTSRKQTSLSSNASRKVPLAR